MPVFTYKDIKEKDDVPVKTPVSQKREVVLEEVIPTERPSQSLYVLLFPENEVGNYKNFQETFTIDGVDYEGKCVNGLLRTTHKALKDYLMSQGYHLIDTIKKEKK